MREPDTRLQGKSRLTLCYKSPNETELPEGASSFGCGAPGLRVEHPTARNCSRALRNRLPNDGIATNLTLTPKKSVSLLIFSGLTTRLQGV